MHALLALLRRHDPTPGRFTLVGRLASLPTSVCSLLHLGGGSTVGRRTFWKWHHINVSFARRRSTDFNRVGSHKSSSRRRGRSVLALHQRNEMLTPLPGSDTPPPRTSPHPQPITISTIPIFIILTLSTLGLLFILYRRASSIRYVVQHQ